MAYKQGIYKILSAAQCNTTCYDFTIACSDIAETAKAGQFVHIRCGDKTLRRPISLCEIDKKNGTIRIVFDVRGEGTLWLSKRQEGDNIDILGPLGNGFELVDILDKKVLFVGGGIGVPPLLETAKAFKKNADAILGFKSSQYCILTKDFERVCNEVFITSDDGSIGTKGFVSAVLNEKLKTNNYDVIYSCGPVAMLKAVCGAAEAHGILCFVSLEERMGCGVGACLVCACKIQSQGELAYKHVCKDGPVFKAEEVVW